MKKTYPYANPFNAELYRLGVLTHNSKPKKSGNKHIPNEYLKSTIQNLAQLGIYRRIV